MMFQRKPGKHFFVQALISGVLWLTGANALATCAPAGTTARLEVDELLQHMRETAMAARACSEPSFGSGVWRAAGPWPSDVCSPGLTFERMCSAADNYCGQRNPNYSHCWFGLRNSSGVTPCSSEEELLQTHRQQISYAGRRFNELTHDLNLQNHCCGTDQGCRTRFSNIRLRILMGLGADDQTGNFSNVTEGVFQGEDTHIQVSVGMLANFVSPDAMDQLFFHELGHACHFVHNNNGTMMGAHALPFSVEASQSALTSYVGADASACVSASLEQMYSQVPDSERSQINREEWYEEALADAIFVRSRSTPGGMNWTCHGSQDNMHAAAQGYTGCFLSIPSVRTAICGG